MVPCSIRIRYQTIEFGPMDIHVRGLRDIQEVPDEAGEDYAESQGIYRHIGSGNWALFGVLWTSGRSLATLMSTYDVEGRRILEVGCGLGLATLVLNKRKADVSATDYHPLAGEFLAENVKLNGGEPVPFARAHWDQLDSGLGKFDLIIGSDILYEPGRAETLARFVDAHAQPKCEVVLVDPGRGQIARFGTWMEGLGYTGTKLPSDNKDPARRREQIHSYRR